MNEVGVDMNKEDFQLNQPIAYKMLSVSLKEKKLSHAYLFYGPPGEAKSQAALLFTQSLFCPHCDQDGFACQECSVCQWIKNEESVDFFWAHANSKRKDEGIKKKELEAYWKNPQSEWQKTDKKKKFSIRKSTIEYLQESFEVTPSNNKELQVYILENYETATSSASNALLKFLEEPKPGVIGILVTEDISKVLDTIQSRCQLIPFRSASLEDRKLLARQYVQEEDQVEMLAHSLLRLQDFEESLRAPFFCDLEKESLEYLKNATSMSSVLHMQKEVFPPKSDQLTKNNVILFLYWILYWLKKKPIYEERLSLELRLEVLESLDRLQRPVDLSLLLDRLYYCMKQKID